MIMYKRCTHMARDAAMKKCTYTLATFINRNPTTREIDMNNSNAFRRGGRRVFAKQISARFAWL